MEPHPRGVQPFGCRLLLGASAADVRASGLGSLAALPDALVMDVLGRLQGAGLAALSCCSRAAAAFCAPEELWRSLALQLFADAGSTVVFTPPGWRSSYAAAAAAATRGRPPPAPSSAARTSVDETGQAAAAPAGGGADGVPPVRCPGLYSDLLYAPHLAAFTPLLPSWLAGESVPRAAAASLTRAAFELAYEAPGLPVLLTGAVAAWPASASWLAGGALAREPLASAPVVAGGHAFAMADYLRYADAVRHDDSPLYLFDRDVLFATSLGGDVELQPHPFGPDLFDLLGGHGDPGRPDFAWLIAGPPRSGSGFHVDPNGTGAWNALVGGGPKRWVLLPPGAPPPGVAPSADGASVAAPTCLLDWFRWWHCALNLGPGVTVGVTRNFVSPHSLGRVLRAVARPELVSGLRSEEARASLGRRFTAALAAAGVALPPGCEGGSGGSGGGGGAGAGRRAPLVCAEPFAFGW